MYFTIFHVHPQSRMYKLMDFLFLIKFIHRSLTQHHRPQRKCYFFPIFLNEIAVNSFHRRLNLINARITIIMKVSFIHAFDPFPASFSSVFSLFTIYALFFFSLDGFENELGYISHMNAFPFKPKFH